MAGPHPQCARIVTAMLDVPEAEFPHDTTNRVCCDPAGALTFANLAPVPRQRVL